MEFERAIRLNPVAERPVANREGAEAMAIDEWLDAESSIPGAACKCPSCCRSPEL